MGSENVYLAAARTALEIEAAAIAGLPLRVDAAFAAAVDVLGDRPGRIVVTGLGKSGHVGRKLAATLASTATTACFVHAAEALHGDAGMVASGDALLAISSSGETHEVCSFAAMVRDRGVPVVAMTGRATSTLAGLSDAVIDISVEREADPLGVAPTTSTLVTAALGDALAAALMVRVGCTLDDFRRHHPAGALGAQLAERP